MIPTAPSDDDLNISEDSDGYLIRAELPELPEVRKEDVKIPDHFYASSGWGINE